MRGITVEIGRIGRMGERGCCRRDRENREDMMGLAVEIGRIGR